MGWKREERDRIKEFWQRPMGTEGRMAAAKWKVSGLFQKEIRHDGKTASSQKPDEPFTSSEGRTADCVVRVLLDSD